jgi:hypothetical protein
LPQPLRIFVKYTTIVTLNADNTLILCSDYIYSSRIIISQVHFLLSSLWIFYVYNPVRCIYARLHMWFLLRFSPFDGCEWAD